MESNGKIGRFVSRARHLRNAFPLDILHLKPRQSSSNIGNVEVKAANPTHENEEKTTKNVDLTGVTLHQAARDGDVPKIEKLLEKCQNPNIRRKKINAGDEVKQAPIHYAARYGHYDTLVFLMKNGADIHAKDEDECTPLHIIAKYKKKKGKDSEDDYSADDNESRRCLKFLIENGANVNAGDSLRQTPLHLACTRNNINVVRELLSFSAIKVDSPDIQGITALHLSCLYGRKKIVQLLLTAGANLRSRDKAKTTPIHFSCVEGNTEVVKLLLDKADALAAESDKASLVTVNETPKGLKLNTSSSSNQLKNLWNVQIAKKNNSDNELVSKNHGHLVPNLSTDNMFKLERRGTDSSVLTALEKPKRGSIDLLQDTDGDKNLPFHLAIENGHVELVKLCIERAKQAGWNDMPRTCRSQKDSALHLAVQANNLDIIKLLLNEGVDVNSQNSLQVTPLMLCCQYNSHDIVHYLIQSGADLELKDLDNLTPLMVACRYGHLETIMCLLEHGADVTETDKDEKTCLMWAAEENRVDAVTFLLTKRAVQDMIEEKNKHNNTALHLASSRGHNDTVKILLEHRASADLKNDDDRTTLHMASLHGHDVIIPVLVNKDRSILNAGDEESNTALHLAAIGGNLKCVTALIKSGTNLEIRNTRQWTALDCAAAFGWEKIARALLEAGANVQPKGKGKVAPLLLACQRGHVDVVNLLLKWKADVAFRSSDGRNALDFAVDFGQKDCVLALIKHETWQRSLKNAIIHPVSGQMLTPMRKLIMKMPDMAMIVCNQCMKDNETKPENDDYAVTFSYELLDDMYSSTEWMASRDSGLKQQADKIDGTYAVYDENDKISQQALTYTSDTNELQANHPLQVMVDYQSESLLLHPLVTGLLNYKWRLFGRYVYYTTLLLFLMFMIILNCYMLLLPLTYQLNWVKIFNLHRYLRQNRSVEDLNLKVDTTLEFESASSSCLFYRDDILRDASTSSAIDSGCFTPPQSQLNLRWVIFLLSIFNLFRCFIQILNQRRNYFTLRNTLETILYVLTLLVSIDYSAYTVENIEQLTGGDLPADEVEPLPNFQQETGMRLGWQEEAGAFAVFLSWMVLLLHIQMIPKLGIFVAMFTDVLKTFAQFFIVFAFFIVAFALSFHILLGNQHEFELWYEALVKTTVMTIGELDYGDIFFSAPDDLSEIGQDYHAQVYTRQVSIVLFVIFLMIMTILIMNLLVGLAVGDIIEVQKNATLESLGKKLKCLSSKSDFTEAILFIAKSLSRMIQLFSGVILLFKTVALILQVEFTLPSFLRKRICLRKQVIQVNKYRNANIIKRFFFYNSNLSLESISKAVDEEEAEQDEARTAEDKVLIGLNMLRGRLSDVLSEQGELKEDVRGVTSLVRQTKMESKLHAENIKENISETSTNLSGKIDFARTGLTETTLEESDQTRDRVKTTLDLITLLKEELSHEINQVKKQVEDTTSNLASQIESTQSGLTDTTLDQSNQTRTKVDGTISLVNQLQLDLVNTKQDIANLASQIESTQSGLTETTLDQSNQTRTKVDGTISLVNQLQQDVVNTKQDIARVKSELEGRIQNLQDEIRSRNWTELQNDVRGCHEEVARTKAVVVALLQELKSDIHKQRYMTAV